MKTGRPKIITYREAIREAFQQSMSKNSGIFLMGCGVSSPDAIFGSIGGLLKRFGENRVIETPIAENGMAGVCIGTALCGMHPVLIFQRIDFALMAMDQIVNHAAKWHYMYGGKMHVPFLLRGVIGRGWGQGAQHSQSLQSLFAHIPGLKVVMPSSPRDAKGLLISSLKDKNPVVFLEYRSLYDLKEEVPKEYYSIPLGKGRIVKPGNDITVVAISGMVEEAKKAAKQLKKDKIDIEIIDPRSLKPLDEELILRSIKKTGRLIIVDTGWRTCGCGAEIAALAVDGGYAYLKAPVKRISLAECPAPNSQYLEKIFYPGQIEILKAVKRLFSVGGGRCSKR